MARVSVMSDHMAEVGRPPSDTDDGFPAPPPIPSGATGVPHGPFSAESPELLSAPTTTVQPVPQTPVESSPFLQALPPESLLASQEVKPQIETPLFLNDKKPANQVGMAEPSSLPRAVTLNQASKNAPEEKKIFLRDPALPSSQKPWGMLGIFLLFLCASLGGAYYYFYVYSETQSGLAEHRDADLPLVVEEEEKDPSDFAFSVTMPNYLSVNVETLSAEGLRTQLTAIGTQMQLAHIETPVEFLVTDQNNSPIAFARFVALIGLKLPQNVVSMTEEEFSLFVFSDQGHSRVGLSISLKNTKTALETLKKAEVDFPVLFQSLFLESKSFPPKKYVFKESLHNGTKIRYANISEPDFISIDYAVEGNRWFLGTSKQSLRAVLDEWKK
jgi:hypothetical protein